MGLPINHNNNHSCNNLANRHKIDIGDRLMTNAEFHALPDVKFTHEALTLCTPEQLEAVKRQMGDKGMRKLSVFVDFSLPTGYLYCVRHTVYLEKVGTIHMGIDPEGTVST